MNIKLLTCALFGHDFTETTVTKEEFNGKEYTARIEDKCDRCGLSRIDNTGYIKLYYIKYGTYNGN